MFSPFWPQQTDRSHNWPMRGKKIKWKRAMMKDVVAVADVAELHMSSSQKQACPFFLLPSFMQTWSTMK